MNKSNEEVLLKMLKGKKLNIQEIIDFLKKQKNIDLNKLDNHGYNFLHYAIKTESPEIVNLMLTSNSSNQTLLNDDETPVAEDNLNIDEVFNFNSQNKADPNLKTNDETNGVYLTPLNLALNYVSDTENCYKIVKCLLKSNADLMQKDENGANIAHKAAELGRIDLINCFKEKHEDILNSNTKFGGLLHYAIIGDNQDTVTYLLENNIDLNLKDENGNNALTLSIIQKKPNLFKQIADYVIKQNNTSFTNETKKNIFNSVNNYGNTILHELAYSKSSVLIDFINKLNPEYAINKELQNKEGYTYKGVQENIVKLEREKENRLKEEKELIRREKLKLAEEIKKEQIAEKERVEKLKLEDEKSRKRRELLLSYRAPIFAILALLAFFILLFFINRAANKKKEEIII